MQFEDGHPAPSEYGGQRAYGAQNSRWKAAFNRAVTPEDMERLVKLGMKWIEEEPPMVVQMDPRSVVAWRQAQIDMWGRMMHAALGKEGAAILVQINNNNGGPDNAAGIRAAAARLQALGLGQALPHQLRNIAPAREVVDESSE